MPAVASEVVPPRRSVLKLSMGLSAAVFIALIAGVLLFGASAADAGTWTMTQSGTGTFYWSNPSGPPSSGGPGMWTPPGVMPPGCNYPGQLPCPAGDTVQLNGLTGSTMIVDVSLPTSFTLSVASTGFTLQVPAAGAINLTGTSSFGSGGTWTISGGTVTNAGTVNINPGATLTFTGGTLLNNSTLNINSGPTTAGTFTWGGGTLDGTGFTQIAAGPTSATFNITATVTMNGNSAIQSATPNFTLGGSINTSFGSPAIFNQGTMTQSAGPAAIQPRFSNTGIVSLPTTGLILQLLGGGTHTNSTWSFGSSGSGIGFNGGHTFDGTTLTWTAPSGAVFHQLGGTTTITLPLTVSDFIQDAGIVNGGGTINVTNSFTWTGGTQTIGTTQLSGNCVGNINGSNNVTLGGGRNLTLSGVAPTLHYAPTGGALLSIIDGALLNILSGTMFLDAAVPINSNLVGGPGLIISGGGGTPKLQQTVVGLNTLNVPVGFAGVGGTIQSAAGGTIRFTAGSALSYDWGGGSSFNLTGAGSAVDLNGGTFKFNVASAPTISGAGLFQLSGNATVNLNGRVLNLTNAQQDGTSTWLGGSTTGGTLSVGGTYNWNGGTMDGQSATPAASLTTTSFGGVVNINGNSPMTATNGWRIINTAGPGSINFNPTLNGLGVNSGAQINNQALFGIQNSNGLGITTDNLGAPVFANSGNVIKSGAANTPTPIDLPFNNNGALTVNANNTLQLRGGGTSGTAMFLVNGTLDFNAGTYSLGAGTTLNAAGTGVYELSGGTLNLLNAFSVQNYKEIGGTLNVVSPNSLTVTNQMIWNGGTISGSGVVTSSGTLAIGNTAPTLLDLGATLSVNGTAQYNADTTNFLSLHNGSRLVISSSPVGNFTINTATGNFIGTDATATHVDNGGVFTKSGAGTTQINSVFNQAGPPGAPGAILNVTGGILKLNGGGSSNGPFNVAGGAILSFTAGAYGISAGSSFAGTGFVQCAGTLTITPAVSMANFDLMLGTLNGAGAVTITSALRWEAGTMSGAGSTSVSGTTTMTLTSSAFLDARTFNNSGTLTLTPTGGQFYINNGAIFNNQSSGTFNVNGDGSLAPSMGTGTFNNSGMFAKTGGVATFFVEPGIFNNQSSGTFKAGPGILGLNNTINTSGVFDFYGRIDIYGGTTNVNSGATFIGAGQLNQFSGTLAANASVTIPRFGVAGGTITGAAPNVLTIDNFAWNAGTMSGTGTTTITTNAIITAGGPMIIDTRTLNNAGVITYRSATNNLTLQNGAMINNSATFVVDLTTPGGIDGTGTIANTSTFQVAGGTGPFTLAPGVTLTNTTAPGLLHIFTGTLALQGPFTNSLATITVESGATLSSTNPVVLGGGLLNGNGTVVANVTNDGNVSPGLSPGILNITGNYTQTSAGALNIELGGTTVGTQYDQLNVSGAVTLAGTLNVTTISGFTPSTGNSFTILTFGSRPGSTDFTTKNGMNPPITPTYTANSLVLGVVSADLAITKSGPTTVAAGSTVTYTITVVNSGPSDALAVTVGDTPSGLTFVSNSGACTTAFPCALGTVPFGSTATINATYSVPLAASGPFSNTASVSSPTFDPNSANNTSTVSGTIVQKADVSVTKTGPAVAQPGTNVTYNITVTNNGPSVASSVTLNDSYTPAARLTFISATGACSSFPCSLGNMNSGASLTTQATYKVVGGPTTTIVNTASVSSSTPDPNGGNNSASVSTSTGCPTGAPSITFPADGATNVAVNGTFTWTDVNASNYIVYLDVVGPNGSCSKFFAASGVPSQAFVGLQPGTTYQLRVEAVNAGCQTQSSTCIKFTTLSNCPAAPPMLTAPVSGFVSDNATYSWTAVSGAVDYKLFVNGNLVTTTTATSFGPVPVGNGPVSWYVVAEFAAPCPSLQSQSATFNGCSTAEVPLPSLVAQAESGEKYTLTWTVPTGSTSFQVDESTDQNFVAASTTTQTVSVPAVQFQHTVNTTTAFYYRVRAVLPCGTTANSLTVRVVMAPLTSPTDPNVSVPVGNTALVPIRVHIPGFPGQTLPFAASLDKPWLVSVQPNSGLLPPEGIDLIVFADPSGLPNGTFTGTVILLVTTPGSGTITTLGTQPVSAPVSISKVTPITPAPAGPPVSSSLIILSAGHLDGVNSKWQSDAFVANISQQKVKYQLTFSPDDPAKGVKQTIIDVDPGATTALVDIVKTWYGVGSLGESANGVLEIRPVTGFGKGAPVDQDVSVSLTTVATSRAYNVTAASGGILGETVPALPFTGFVGRALDSAHTATVLGLQQIAQNDVFHTNIGVVEASGQPASVLISAFDGNGNRLLDFPMDLRGGEQRQLNSFLAQNKISLTDGRIEVKVTGGEGKVTAYASVIDGKSGDPYLVSAVPLGQSSFDHFVLPGVADLNTGVAAWRTDMEILNPSTTPQLVTLTFNPQSGGSPQTASTTINPGQLKQFNSVLASLFNVTNTGGAIHVTTASPAPLVVSGRTFDLTSNGTFGQSVPAVTSDDAVGLNGHSLQILQVEDSVRSRMNLGVFEVTGKPATVEVSVFLPDSKISPSTQIPIPANGFVQVPVIQSLGLNNIYNARVSVKVVGGDGKVSAYGSVIDQKTQAPMYVPAQQSQ